MLACLLVCLPVSQALAEVQIEAAEVDGKLLFPEDSLVNAWLPVMMDGIDVSAENPGSWTNTDSGIVYSASVSDTEIVLTEAGYVLVVENGTAALDDGTDESKYHKDTDSKDVACYEKDDIIRIKAAEPEEGMVFTGWISEDVSFADASSAETTITMPEHKTTVTATYGAVSVEEPTEAPTEAPVEEPMEVMTEAPVEEPTEAPVEVSTEAPVEEPTEAATEAPVGEPIGAANEWTDPNITLGADTPVDTYTDQTEAATETEPETSAAVDYYAVMVNNGSVDDETTGVRDEIGTLRFTEGTEVSVTANAAEEGQEFTGWISGDGNDSIFTNPMSETTTFIMPKNDVTVSATYATKVSETESSETEEQTASPETQAPETEEQTVSPETQAPETEEQTVSPETQAPETEAQTVSPETQAPETEAQTVSPETQAPETEAQTVSPETQATETETEAVTETPQLDDETYEVVVENGTGSGFYKAGDTVTVQAEGEEGLEFQNWETSSADVQMSDPNQTTATFIMPEEGVVVKAEYADPAPSTTITITGGKVVSPVSDTGVYAVGTAVEIELDASTVPAGKQFAGWVAQWDDGANGIKDVEFTTTGTKATFNMPGGPVTITATYSDITYTVLVANGTLVSEESQHDPADPSKYIVKANKEVLINANPNPAGQAFTGWIIRDAQGTEIDPAVLGLDAKSSSLTLASINQSLNFQAQYEGIQYNVKVNDGSANYTTAVSGTNVTITADKAPKGMEFDYWKVDSGNATLANASSATTTFAMPMADVTVSANYKYKEYRLTVENGTGSQKYFYMGDKATVSSNYPASGKEFDKWVATSGNVEFENASRWKTTFEMPASDVTAKATYKDGPSPDNNQILELVAGGEYYTGASIKFTASGAGMGNTNPNPGDYRYRPSGYQIGNVTGSWDGSPYTTSMTIKATGEYTLKVTYNKEIFDGSNWAADGTTDTKSVTFKVIPKAAGVATGDETPIGIVVAIAAVSCLLFIILLVVFLKRRKAR